MVYRCIICLRCAQVYISTGAGARVALSDRKIAAVIAAMRPLLRAADYNAAIEQVLRFRCWPCLNARHHST